MQTYIIRRVLQMILILFLVTIIVFFMVRLLPGDPILLYLSQQEMDQTYTLEEIEHLRHEVGLDRPMVIQYFDWLGDVLTGDLGTSIITKRPLIDDVRRRLPISLHIGGLSFLVSIVIGIPLGVVAAVKRNTWWDNVLTTLANFGICTPNFWLGILMIYLIGFKAGWLPIYGYTSPFTDPWLNLKQIIMPVFVLGTSPIASGVRLTRSSMLEVLRQDYIRTAWSKGLRERSVIIGHALKNGLIPVITLKGMTLTAIIGGSVIIETVFSIPGMGRLAVEGMFAQDYTIVQGTLLIFGSVTLAANLLVDISYGWLDPRIRYG